MTRPSRAALIPVAAVVLALTACGTPASPAGQDRHQPGSAELGASPGAGSAAPADGGTAADSGGAGTGDGHPKSTAATGGGTSTSTSPRIVSLTATGAVCPVVAKPGAPFSRPGQVTVTWKISGADGADLLMDKGLWHSYTGVQGADTLPFACPDPTAPATHTYTLTVKGGAVSKTVSATARPNP